MLGELPYPYSYFHSLQERCRRAATARDYGWGLECALNYLVDAIAAGTVPPNPLDLEAALRRVIASGGRLHRSHSTALVKWAPSSPPVSTDDMAAEARIEISKIAGTVSAIDGEVLADAALGYTAREIADRRASTPGAIRVRLARVRLKLAA